MSGDIDEDGLRSLVEQQLRPVFALLDDMSDVDKIVKTEAVRQALNDANANAARLRRVAVRKMRGEGMLLREIADACGMSHQRISQIEAGYSRRDER